MLKEVEHSIGAPIVVPRYLGGSESCQERQITPCRTSGCEDHGCAKEMRKGMYCVSSISSYYPYHHMAGLVTRFKPAQGHACDTRGLHSLIITMQISTCTRCLHDNDLTVRVNCIVWGRLRRGFLGPETSLAHPTNRFPYRYLMFQQPCRHYASNTSLQSVMLDLLSLWQLYTDNVQYAMARRSFCSLCAWVVW